jgi:hypothetical protein
MRMLSEVLRGARACRADCAVCERLRGAAAAAVLAAGGGAVTVADLAAAAGVPAGQAAGHCPEGSARVVADAYERASEQLFGEYVASFRAAGSWGEKLSASLQRLLRRLADEPAVAHLCFVGPAAGDGRVGEIREAFRQRYVRLLAVEQSRQAPGELLPELQLELMVAAVFRAIGRLVHEGRAPELPTLLEDVAGAAQVFEPRAVLTA